MAKGHRRCVGRKYTEETLLKMSKSQKTAKDKRTTEQIKMEVSKAKETKLKNGTTGKGILRPEMKGDLNPAKKTENRKKMKDYTTMVK